MADFPSSRPSRGISAAAPHRFLQWPHLRHGNGLHAVYQLNWSQRCYKHITKMSQYTKVIQRLNLSCANSQLEARWTADASVWCWRPNLMSPSRSSSSAKRVFGRAKSLRDIAWNIWLYHTVSSEYKGQSTLIQTIPNQNPVVLVLQPWSCTETLKADPGIFVVSADSTVIVHGTTVPHSCQAGFDSPCDLKAIPFPLLSIATFGWPLFSKWTQDTKPKVDSFSLLQKHGYKGYGTQ